MNPLWERLTEQTGNKDLAKNILVDRGHMDVDGNLTPEGLVRSNMSPEERALDRHVQKYGGTADDYEYDPETNTCRKCEL